MQSNRRRFFKAVAGGAAGVALGSKALAAPPKTGAREDEGPVLLVGDTIAVAETQHGKVRGYVLRGIHHFLGIPYGADTSGANRFMPPQKPKPWTTVFPALWWGNTAPQNMDRRYADAHYAFRDHWNYDDVSEDCLRLNVFTPALGGAKKRPVLVWLHGGGFVNGNAHRAGRLQRREPGARRRDGLRLDQPPPGRARLLRPGRRRRQQVRSLGQRGHARLRGRARVGARQHRGLRRRPGQRHDHGPVRRRREGLRA